jgi:hypothetical protein
MSNTIYLYLKTHNVTGLKYLGKTTQDPFEYQGSGIVWSCHLKKYGYDVTTEILLETTCKKEFKRVATEYSEKWNIVESKEFANLTTEQGQGGRLVEFWTEETYKKISKKSKGIPKSKEHKEKLSLANKGKTHSEETKRKMSENSKGEKNGRFGLKITMKPVCCLKCRKEMGINNFPQHLRGKNCK